MNYSEFMKMLNDDVDGRFQLILDYEDFQAYLDWKQSKYLYVECGENDASTIKELELVASLIYSIDNDIKIPHDNTGEYMNKLFDCDVCGEYICDTNMQYLWFKLK